MLIGVCIEHEIDQCALKFRAQTVVDGKSRTCNLRRPLKIQNAEIWPEVPMRLRLEIELPRFAHAANLDVFFFTLADWYGFLRKVRNPGQQFAESIIHFLRALVERGNPFTDLTDLRLAFSGVLSF